MSLLEFESRTFGLKGRCSTVKLQTQKNLFRGGIEPPTNEFSIHCSTAELPKLSKKIAQIFLKEEYIQTK